MGNFILGLLSAILIYCFFHFKLWKKEKWGFLKIFKSKTRSIPSGGGGGGFTPNNETNENEFVNHYDEENIMSDPSPKVKEKKRK